jgi:hypothetical protein
VFEVRDDPSAAPHTREAESQHSRDAPSQLIENKPRKFTQSRQNYCFALGQKGNACGIDAERHRAQRFLDGCSHSLIIIILHPFLREASTRGEWMEGINAVEICGNCEEAERDADARLTDDLSRVEPR